MPIKTKKRAKKRYQQTEDDAAECARLRGILADLNEESRVRKELADDVCRWLEEEMDPHFRPTEQAPTYKTQSMKTELITK